LRLIKGSLRPGGVLERLLVEDPATLDREALTGSGGGVDIRRLDLLECDRPTMGLGDPNIEARDFLVDSKGPVLSLLLALLETPGGLVGSGEDGPVSRGLPCPFEEVSCPLRRLCMTPYASRSHISMPLSVR